MKTSERERRAFLADPELRLIDIPHQAALNAAKKVTHQELKAAIESAQAEYRAQRPTRRRKQRNPG